MPAKPALEVRANQVLGTPGSPEYLQAKQIVAAAGSLTQAVQSANFFLGPMHATDQNEINAMLGQIPAGVAQGLLDSIRNALQADRRVAFVWNPHPTGGYDHSESAGADGVAHLELRTPAMPNRPATPMPNPTHP
jgi:hypothetical protein